jgi:hypothetical protein
MNSPQKDLFLTPLPASCSRPVTIELRGIVVPSFKNNKILIAKSPSGKPLERPLLITKPENQKTMDKITDSIALQLLSAFRTDDGVTLTGRSLRCAIASCVPEDDCWTKVPEITIKGELCEPGNEGATIIIERL